ncbi:MAG: hypothetical protein KJ017_11385 [Alphaproteobacteria bacterium]|nr:hypothetical protein [Alphaproteobacteria bacterium]
MILARDIVQSKIDPELVFYWTYNLSLELVVMGILLGAFIGAVFFWRVKRPARHRAVIGAFVGFYLSIFGVVALFVLAEAYQILSM